MLMEARLTVKAQMELEKGTAKRAGLSEDVASVLKPQQREIL